MDQEVEQNISDLTVALNNCPQGRLSQLLKYAMVVLNLLLGCNLLLLLYFLFFVPNPTPEQVFTFLKFAVIFFLLYLPISYLQVLPQEAVIFWRLRVRISVVVICSSSQHITEKQKHILQGLINSRRKELDLAFGRCDESTIVVYRKLLKLWTIASPD